MVAMQTSSDMLATKLAKPEATSRAVLNGDARKYDLKWVAVRGTKLA